jgi:hypothetical protein
MERTNVINSVWRLALAGGATALLVAACSGGGSGSSTPATTTPTSAPTSAATNPMELYLVPASSADGNPVVVPTGALGATTVSVSFDAVSQKQGVLVVEAGFSGTYTATITGSACNSGVTVAPASITGSKSGVFVITAAAAGTCAVQISDGTNVGSALVDVTTTSGSISSSKRN